MSFSLLLLAIALHSDEKKHLIELSCDHLLIKIDDKVDQSFGTVKVHQLMIKMILRLELSTMINRLIFLIIVF